jgi:hypothetical protein
MLLFLHTWAEQLVRGVFHLDISLTYWFRITEILLCFQEIPHGWCTDIFRDHFEHSPDCLLIKNFYGKKQNIWSWDYSPQVLDYQDF